MQDDRGRRVPNSQAKTSNFDPHSSSILPNPLPSPSLRNGTLWYRYLYGSIDFPLFFTISLAIRGRVRKQTLVASGHHRHHKVEQYGCPNVLSSFDNRTFWNLIRHHIISGKHKMTEDLWSFVPWPQIANENQLRVPKGTQPPRCWTAWLWFSSSTFSCQNVCSLVKPLLCSFGTYLTIWLRLVPFIRCITFAVRPSRCQVLKHMDGISGYHDRVQRSLPSAKWRKYSTIWPEVPPNTCINAFPLGQ